MSSSPRASTNDDAAGLAQASPTPDEEQNTAGPATQLPDHSSEEHEHDGARTSESLKTGKSGQPADAKTSPFSGSAGSGPSFEAVSGDKRWDGELPSSTRLFRSVNYIEPDLV